jgi:hypothetical protein
MIPRGLKDLKSLLPAHVEIWAGGAGIASAKLQLDGVQTYISLDSIALAVRHWREKHPALSHAQTEQKSVQSAA